MGELEFHIIGKLTLLAIAARAAIRRVPSFSTAPPGPESTGTPLRVYRRRIPRVRGIERLTAFVETPGICDGHGLTCCGGKPSTRIAWHPRRIDSNRRRARRSDRPRSPGRARRASRKRDRVAPRADGPHECFSRAEVDTNRAILVGLGRVDCDGDETRKIPVRSFLRSSIPVTTGDACNNKHNGTLGLARPASRQRVGACERRNLRAETTVLVFMAAASLRPAQKARPRVTILPTNGFLQGRLLGVYS